MQEDTCLNFPYLPATAEDRQEMLKEIGVKTFENLLDHIPKEVRAKALTMKDGLSELELTQHLKALAAKKQTNLAAKLIFRWWQLSSLCASGCTYHYLALRICHCLHSLSA